MSEIEGVAWEFLKMRSRESTERQHIKEPEAQTEHRKET